MRDAQVQAIGGPVEATEKGLRLAPLKGGRDTCVLLPVFRSPDDRCHVFAGADKVPERVILKFSVKVSGLSV